MLGWIMLHILTSLLTPFDISAIPKVTQLWKESLVALKREKTAQALADPTEYEDMFPDLQYALQAEEAIKVSRAQPVPATAYYQWRESLGRDIITGMCWNLTAGEYL